MKPNVDMSFELSAEQRHPAPDANHAKKTALRSIARRRSTFVNAVESSRVNMIDVPSLALTLMPLNELLDRRAIQEYWNEGMKAFLNKLPISSASLSLLEQVAGLDRSAIRMGDLSSNIAQYLNVWEKMLSVAWKSPVDSPYFEMIELPAPGETYVVLHVYIMVSKLVRGAVSFVFDMTMAPSPSQCEAIAHVAQAFVSSGLRSSYYYDYQTRLEASYSLYTILQSLNSSLDLRTVLDEAISLATVVLDVEAATIFRADVANNRLVFMVTKGSVADVLEERSIPLDRGVVGWVFKHGESQIIDDTAICEAFDSTLDSQTGFVTRNILCVPLRFQNKSIGVLEVLNKRGSKRFSEDDVNWLSVIGEQVAVAIHNAELYQALRSDQERIIKAQEDVRHHLARELHDNTAQMLNLIAMRLDMSRNLLQQGQTNKVERELESIEQIARQANREVRTLLYELRPIILESQGLIPALEAYHRQLTNTMSCNVHWESDLFDIDMSLQDASGIFSIIQEAVNNVRKHARAQNVWIRVYLKEEKLWFDIEDDGVGFDPAAIWAKSASAGSYGLLNMHERATMLQGELTFHSPRAQGGNGALVRGSIPLAMLKRNSSHHIQTWSTLSEVGL
jgi:signal transduction histidine kinase